jgi:replicative DNA helicase
MKPEISPALPHNLNAERAVLGAILIGNRKAPVAFDMLHADDFLSEQHRKIFSKADQIHKAGRPVDVLLLDDELRAAGELEAAGGTEFLSSLIDGVPRVDNVEHYARLVKDKAILRALLHATEAVQQQAMAAEGPATEILDAAIERLSGLARDAESNQDGGTPYRDAAVRFLETTESGSGMRVFTGVELLDDVTGGFRAGELVLFTGGTGMGKTLLSQQTRRHACRDGFHGLYCSGEMRAEHLISRELATEARVAHWKMRQPEQITTEEMRSLVEVASHECIRCQILDGELSIGRIRRVARRVKDLGLVVMDYDELITADGEDELDQQRNLVRGAKSLAIELGCPVILVSQLRKPLTGEDAKRPTLERLYGSGAKTKHASSVIYVDRQYVRELKGLETAARIVVLKNRDGRVGQFDAVFNVKTLRFEAAQEKQEHPEQQDAEPNPRLPYADQV